MDEDTSPGLKARQLHGAGVNCLGCGPEVWNILKQYGIGGCGGS